MKVIKQWYWVNLAFWLKSVSLRIKYAEKNGSMVQFSLNIDDCLYFWVQLGSTLLAFPVFKVFLFTLFIWWNPLKFTAARAGFLPEVSLLHSTGFAPNNTSKFIFGVPSFLKPSLFFNKTLQFFKVLMLPTISRSQQCIVFMVLEVSVMQKDPCLTISTHFEDFRFHSSFQN